MKHRTQRDLLAYLVLTASVACLAAAQETATVELPHFDVASIKAEDPDVPHTVGVRVYPGGRVAIDGFPLRTLITTAFDLGFWQVSGGDEWVSKDIYFLEAMPSDALRSSIKRAFEKVSRRLAEWNPASPTIPTSPMLNGANWNRWCPPPNPAAVPPSMLDVKS